MAAKIGKKTSSSINRSRSSRSGTASSILEIGDRSVPVSRLEKVFYPRTGFTKAQIIDYYIRISPVLLPHLKDRPVTLKRYPDGVEGAFFYEKRCPPYRPAWVKTAPVWSDRKESKIDYCLFNDLPSLVWAVNLGDLELHTFLSRARDVKEPTQMVFDLDPGPPAGILECGEVSIWLKEKLDREGLQSFPKTSGSKGLQIYVPVNTRVSYEQTKGLAHRLAQELEREHPQRVVSKMEKRLRKGKVLVDWSQNDEHKTTVCVYSLRAKEEPLVSTPVTWDEVAGALNQGAPERLKFPAETVLERVKVHGDLFEQVLRLKQKLPRAKAQTLAEVVREKPR